MSRVERSISILRRIYRALRRFLRVVSRPVRRDRGLDGVVIQPYRGYGTPEEIYVMGRVFRQPTFGARLPEGSILREIADVLRRFARWGLDGAQVIARLGDARQTFATDRDGYFHVELRRARSPHGNPGPGGSEDSKRWHSVRLEVVRGDDRTEDQALVYVPPPTARYVVVSDIDDTVMHTGVANRLKMLWRLFVQSAESRVAFPGVVELYQALHDGLDDEGNPMLYVSRAPWSVYEVLAAFFRLKGIPEGPVLFLREWGLTLQRPLPRRAEDHKRDLIDGMLRRYHDLPFVLIGDSGQHDPEIYVDIVRRHPDRVRAVYIREVGSSARRRTEVLALARELAEVGCPMILASDSPAMAEHARQIGLIR